MYTEPDGANSGLSSPFTILETTPLVAVVLPAVSALEGNPTAKTSEPTEFSSEEVSTNGEVTKLTFSKAVSYSGDVFVTVMGISFNDPSGALAQVIKFVFLSTT